MGPYGWCVRYCSIDSILSITMSTSSYSHSHQPSLKWIGGKGLIWYWDHWSPCDQLHLSPVCSISHSVSLCLTLELSPLTPDDIVDRQVADGLIGPELREKVSFVLLRKHRHQHKKPMHRSLADMGKSNNCPASECVCASVGLRACVCVCVEWSCWFHLYQADFTETIIISLLF